MAFVGKRVHSFDFDDRSLTGDLACYVTGIVRGILKAGDLAADGETVFHDCDRYVIVAESRTFTGELTDLAHPGQQFFPPLNGTETLMTGETMSGVVLAETPQDLSFRIMYNALSLLTMAPDVVASLEELDPAMLRQIRRAIETAETVADDALLAPYNGDVPDEARAKSNIGDSNAAQSERYRKAGGREF